MSLQCFSRTFLVLRAGWIPILMRTINTCVIPVGGKLKMVRQCIFIAPSKILWQHHEYTYARMYTFNAVFFTYAARLVRVNDDRWCWCDHYENAGAYRNAIGAQ